MQKSKKKRTNHKQEEHLTKEQRTHRRLSKSYASQPFHERNYYLHIITYIFGWGANAISGVTEASRIFAFFMGILGGVLHGSTFSWGITIFAILIFEIVHRLLAQGYFREYVRNEGHDRSMNKNLIAMIAVGIFLTILSVTGGFDLIRLTTDTPQQIAAKQYDVSDYQNALNPLVNQAQQDAEKFRQSKLWKGKLSDKNTRRYNELLDAAKTQENVLAQSVATLPQRNLALQAQADSINVNRQKHYESAIQDRGYGLGGVTILAILVMYICVYFSELYRLKHKDYLDRKYGEISHDELEEKPIKKLREHDVEDMDNIVQAVLQHIEVNTTSKLMQQREHKDEASTINGTIVHNLARNPIGFHRPSKQSEHIGDLYTIIHEYRKAGNTVKTHYNLPTVRGRVAQYERKLAKMTKSSNGYEKAKAWHKYWQKKEIALTQKLKQNGLLQEVLQSLE